MIPITARAVHGRATSQRRRSACSSPALSFRVIPELRTRHSFPLTRLSLVAGLGAAAEPERRAAADLLARAYWGPVYALMRFRWGLDSADAEDLTQEFFAAALEKNWLARYEPARARFRTFLRVCVDRFAANAIASRRRLKRGGGVADEPIEVAAAQLASAPDEMDERIREAWVRGVLGVALDALRTDAAAAGKRVHVAVFEAYDVDDPPDARPTYRELGARFGIAETQVTNYLNWARREYRRCVLATLRALAGNDAEFREDARELLGARRQGGK
jgi:RNA polymerase sigma factor (sigma-70 family)